VAPKSYQSYPFVDYSGFDIINEMNLWRVNSLLIHHKFILDP